MTIKKTKGILMNKKFFYSLVLLASSVITTAFLTTNSFALDKNEVRFEGDVSKVSFTVDPSTPSSPSSCAANKKIDPKSAEEDHGLKIEIKADRHASKTTAKCFENFTDNKTSHNAFNHFPKKLNFVVKGTLTLYDKNGKKYVFPHIVLAQGHSSSRNNWWIGFSGSGCFYPADGDKIECTYEGSSYNYDEDMLDEWCFIRGEEDPGKRTAVDAIKVVHRLCVWK